jgi:hypothetical protein
VLVREVVDVRDGKPVALSQIFQTFVIGQARPEPPFDTSSSVFANA